MSDVQPIEIGETNGAAVPFKPRSGYARLRQRHHATIDALDAMKADKLELEMQLEALQSDVDRLLSQHERLMKAVKTPAQSNWFEGANQALSQLAANPDPRALQIMVGAVAGLQQRLSALVVSSVA